MCVHLVPLCQCGFANKRSSFGTAESRPTWKNLTFPFSHLQP